MSRFFYLFFLAMLTVFIGTSVLMVRTAIREPPIDPSQFENCTYVDATEETEVWRCEDLDGWEDQYMYYPKEGR